MRHQQVEVVMVKLFIGLVKFVLFLLIMPVASVIAVLWNFLPIVISGGDITIDINFRRKDGGL